MNSTIDDRLREAGGDLDEPRFDEEATLLAAQPVVPLVEVKAKTRSKARLALALAIGGGLLIGLLAATLIYRYMGATQRAPAETATVTEQPGTVEPQGYAGGAAIPAEETAVTESEEAARAASQTAEVKVERPNTAPDGQIARPAARQSRPVVVRDLPDRADDEDGEEIDRATRRAERQEERRERRRVAREAKRQNRQQAQTTDDLLRIREIFEGTPRP